MFNIKQSWALIYHFHKSFMNSLTICGGSERKGPSSQAVWKNLSDHGYYQDVSKAFCRCRVHVHLFCFSNVAFHQNLVLSDHQLMLKTCYCYTEKELAWMINLTLLVFILYYPLLNNCHQPLLGWMKWNHRNHLVSFLFYLASILLTPLNYTKSS